MRERAAKSCWCCAPSLFIYVMNVKTCCCYCCCFSPVFVEYLHIFWLSIRWSNFNLQLLLSFASRVNLLACHFSAARYWFIGVTHCALFTTIFDLSAAGWAAEAAVVGAGGHSRICLTLVEHLAAFEGAKEWRKSGADVSLRKVWR